jgi:hypothetical protein
VICNIRVLNQDATLTVHASAFPDFTARGVIGQQYSGEWDAAVRSGDSGGLVFTVNGDHLTRQVRGVVSASYGTRVGSDGANEVFWTEALDIYKQFGVHLTTVQ